MKIETQKGCEFFFGLRDSLAGIQQAVTDEVTPEEQAILTALIQRIEMHLGFFTLRGERRSAPEESLAS